jgi:hydroxymethylglutaryl-CoA reductase
MKPISRLPGFYKLSREERLSTLVANGALTEEAAQQLARGNLLDRETANSMIENVVGIFELPIGLGLNFVIDGTPRIVPMVVEEPSIVAAVSHVAKLAAESGGFTTEVDEPVMIGQIQVTGLEDPERAAAEIKKHVDQILDIANTREPGMKRRGGGAKSVETRLCGDTETPHTHRTMLVVHLLVDTRDAMGANVVNTMCEAVAPFVEEVTGGQVFLRILSNLADKRRVRASCRIPVESLGWKGFSGSEVAHGVEQASRFAEYDPYRATTHNKGIMNGIDAVAIATGQDWRAIEAGAHAWAARDGGYGPLSTWRVEGDELVGRIELPMAVGVVGGPIRLHPTVRILLDLMGIKKAGELASVMAAVGLAQNLAAIKALATQGIQAGHMSLHARSVAATAGVPSNLIDEIAEQMIELDDVKVERARTLLEERDG